MDDRANGMLIGFVIALGVSGAVIVGMLAQTDEVSFNSAAGPVEHAVLSEQAMGLAELLLQSPGVVQGGGDWADNPDALDRLGLQGSRPGDVGFAKLQNLRLAPLEANATDGYVNYEEARTSLGLADQGLDFHIRGEPRLLSLEELQKTGQRDKYMRVGFIGNAIGESQAATGGGAQITGVSCEGVGQNINYEVTALNNGTTTTQFLAILTVQGTTVTVTEAMHGAIVADNATTVIAGSIPAIDTSLCAAGTQVTVKLYDPDVQIASKTFTLAAPSAAPSTAAHHLSVDPSDSYFLTSENVLVAFDSNSLKNKDDVTLLVVDPTNATVYLSTFELGAPNSRTRDIGALPAGEYTVRLSYGSLYVTDTLLVVASSLNPFTSSGTTTGGYSWHSGVATEVGMVESLVEKFCPYLYDDNTGSPMAAPPAHNPRCNFLPAGAQGSVFPDIKSVMNNNLPLYLLDGGGTPRYDYFSILVVGSEVDHRAMTSADAKHAIRDWVYGGGTLVVFGSEEQSVTWLQPIFHAQIKSSSGGINTPDNLHPVLHTPNELDWDGFINPNGNVWEFNAGAGDAFTDVVQQADDAVLTLSDPGAFYDGNVFLTTWLPYDVYQDGGSAAGEQQGVQLIHNLFTLGYRDLYLDYGPPIPGDASVMTSTRLAKVDHEVLGSKPVAFTVYVFEGDAV